MVNRGKSELEADWQARYVDRMTDLSLPSLGSLICIDSQCYVILGLSDEHIVLGKGKEIFEAPLEYFLLSLAKYEFQWGRQRVCINDAALVSRLLSETRSYWDRDAFELPARLPAFPEHRFEEYGECDTAYCRPEIVSSSACRELAFRFLGIEDLPVALAFVESGYDRKEAFVMTAMCPVNTTYSYSSSISLMFAGYKLHSNGLLGDPVTGVQRSGKAFRRTLSNQWVELSVEAGTKL